MVVIGRRGCERLVAAGADTRARHGWNSRTTVLTGDVNDHVGLHGRPVLAAGAGEAAGSALCPVNLELVLRQPALLNEALAAAGLVAGPLELTGVLLHVVEHRVLALLCLSAVRTDKQALLILEVLGLADLLRRLGRRHGNHPTGAWWPWAAYPSTFWLPGGGASWLRHDEGAP